MMIAFKTYKMINQLGEEMEVHPNPNILSTAFYLKSLAAPKLNPISFSDAMRLIWNEHHRLMFANKHQESKTLMTANSMIEFLTQNNFYIAWTGDEFVVLDQKQAC